MNESPPAGSTFAKPDDVRLQLALRGFGHAAVYYHPEQGCMVEPYAVPDEVWIDALRAAGQSPLPCAACFTAGEGADCAAGRCSRPSAPTSTDRPRLILPPGFR